jgi:homoserine dehydrogenase
MTLRRRSPMKALFIGFGNVGRKVAEILSVKKEKYPKLAGLNLQVVGITTRGHGSIVNPSGIGLKSALSEFTENGRFVSTNPYLFSSPVLQAVKNLDYDVLVELSTLSIEDHGEPAVSYVKEALMRGKNVVSANKGPVAFAYQELEMLAKKNNCEFLFESTVMDGAPVFAMARSSLKGCRVVGISGILNSTTNFILSQLEKGGSFEGALKVAQREGFAEADPRHDIEGWDAAAKIAILANVWLKANMTPLKVTREGIAGLSTKRVQAAVQRGKRLKLVCSANYRDDHLRASVKLREMASDHPFAQIDPRGSILKVETDLMNPFFIVQENPGLYDTAYGVLNDLLTSSAAIPIL